jgi:hypothetical protein
MGHTKMEVENTKIPNVVRKSLPNPVAAVTYSEEHGLSLNEIDALIQEGKIKGYSHRNILYISQANQEALEAALAKRGPEVPSETEEPTASSLPELDLSNKTLEPQGEKEGKVAPDHQNISKLTLTDLHELATGIGLKVYSVSYPSYSIHKDRDVINRCDNLEELEKILVSYQNNKNFSAPK